MNEIFELINKYFLNKVKNKKLNYVFLKFIIIIKFYQK